jgi:hypothetical protein
VSLLLRLHLLKGRVRFLQVVHDVKQLSDRRDLCVLERRALAQDFAVGSQEVGIARGFFQGLFNSLLALQVLLSTNEVVRRRCRGGTLTLT